MNEYVTWSALLTQGGAIVGVNVVTATVSKLGGDAVSKYLKFVAVALSLFFSAAFAILVQGTTPTWGLAPLVLVNGAIVFLSAVGSNEVLASQTSMADMTPEPSRAEQQAVMDQSGTPYRSADKPPAPAPKRFLVSWF